MAMKKYWELRLNKCKEALEKNNFSTFVAQTPSDAKNILMEQILPDLNIKNVSWGDSMTLYKTGILPYFREKAGIRLIETFGENISRDKSMERRREAILTDLSQCEPIPDRQNLL